MVKRHKIIAYLKEDEWNLLWQLKSEKMKLPFSKIIEYLIDFYFEKNMLKPDHEFKKKLRK